MSSERIIVGLDVGTTKVCALIGKLDEADQLEIVGAGVTPSRGLRKGVVVSPTEAVESIRVALRRAEQQSGYRAISAFIGVGGAHLFSVNSHGVVAVHRDRVITPEDVSRAHDAARVISIPPEGEVLHVLPRLYVINDQQEVANPVGMLGSRLEVQAILVVGAGAALRNLVGCVERVGVEVEGLVLQPLAAGEAVLTEAEKERGVVLLDIGGGTTDVAVYTEGSLGFVSVLPVGGYHLSNDLALGLRTPFAAAEEIKIRHARALASLVEDDGTIDVASFDRGQSRVAPRRLVSEIVEARLAETFELVNEQLQRAGRQAAPPAGVVLTGGTAQLPGIRRLAEEVLQAPVRTGSPTGVHNMGDAISGPAYAASVGLLTWGRTQLDDPTAAADPTPVWKALSGVGRWLRGFFP